MLAGLISFGSAFLLAGIVEGLYALAERRKEARIDKAVRELYRRRLYR